MFCRQGSPSNLGPRAKSAAAKRTGPSQRATTVGATLGPQMRQARAETARRMAAQQKARDDAAQEDRDAAARKLARWQKSQPSRVHVAPLSSGSPSLSSSPKSRKEAEAAAEAREAWNLRKKILAERERKKRRHRMRAAEANMSKMGKVCCHSVSVAAV